MDQLFVEIELINRDNQTEIYTTVHSFIALYVYKYLNSPSNIKLNYVKTYFHQHAKIRLNTEALNELNDDRIICKNKSTIQAIRDLKLPAYVKDKNTFISGLCAVCREVVDRNVDSDRRELLGFKQSCLLAPAESSIWTRFCEVNILQALEEVLLGTTTTSTESKVYELPQELPRFEAHMGEPVRMHNIYKLARENANKKKEKKGKVIIECTTPKETLGIEHRFAEGITFTIADLLLYPCFRLILGQMPVSLVTADELPRIHRWMKEIESTDEQCQQVLEELYPEINISKKTHTSYKMPEYEHTSLYKSDPKRYKPRNRIFTEQSEIDSSLEKLSPLQIEFSSDTDVAYDMPIDWNAIEPDQSKTSALPEERLDRKRKQLENVANAVKSLAEDGDRIIDFCSGTGHLGILLALTLPKCSVIFLENKAISLQKAKTRAEELGLTNCLFYQCNIDYFEGIFDIGTSLHACGTATDIVLNQCIRSRAKFVCCPCCYGSIQPMPHIKYPLSKRFQSALSERDFLHIAHAADQAHELGTLNCKPETTFQGQMCMDIVDSDRKLHAEEAGYEVILTRLRPENCTPKNRLLVGVI
ncbi:glutathione S-transferase C-terminal domain-containing protein homolog [Episyrphus balteatus]|uniref:glutathione S-transferase C-terminal domain-containing protein homolog n=1 Tax=Episyrphus balteatus TaxID=286459 RepID=UPI0024855A1D|nr:glutathione S-transferase C-terminal domain-containing protein homolog [Episyrphus balteatus]